MLSYLKSVNPNELYKMDKNIFLKCKEELLKNGFNDNTFKNLKEKEREELGFRTWSKETKEKGLIPLYIFNLLDEDTELFCPFNKEFKIEKKRNCDDDHRGGCVAYEFV